MKNVLLTGLCACFITGLAFADTFGTGENQFDIDFVGISGNTNPTSGYGIVNYDYRIGKYEITNDQWSKFKNEYGAVAGSPSTSYDENPQWTGSNIPTNNTSWYEAAQFVNWLNTSTGHKAAYNFTGTQGTGDYTFATWSLEQAWVSTNLYRNKDAYYFLPSDDEWVKAAYWNGTSLQTYSNASAGDLVSGVPDPSKWNYSPSAGYEPWNVGSGVQELNGTFDMMGNLWEYNETCFPNDSGRIVRGCGFDGGTYYLESSHSSSDSPSNESPIISFRVASVPEPTSFILLSAAGLALRRKIK